MEQDEPWRCRSASNFEKLHQVGEGTYGNVFKARDRLSHEVYAMKKIKMEREKEGFPITALREIRILKKLNHTNIIKLKEIVTSKAKDERQPGNVYLLFEYMEHDLEGLLNMTRPRIEYTVPHLKCFIKQMLQALEYLHSQNIVHRDVKCANLLVNNKGEVKLGDFGLARNISRNPDELYTNRVITLWYRPPELLLGATKYTYAVDMWSAGCILGEILTRAPMFPEDKEPRILQKIYALCGTPHEEIWPGVSSLPYWEQYGPREQIPRVLKVKYADRASYPNFDEQAIDLLDKLLQLNPANRLTASEALAHPYFHSDPLPCSPQELPKVEVEMHELELKKQRKEKLLNQRGQVPPPQQGYPKAPQKRPQDHRDPTPVKKHKSLEDPSILD
jgi:cyclin-dependent kinase 12/13